MDNHRPVDTTDILSGGGELGARMRSKDWSTTPLGPPQTWPQSLKTSVRIMLTSRQPMFVWWGDELINLYNDAYKTMMDALEPDQQAKLREMQRSWIHTRDLTCAFWYDYFQGTMANPMIAYCNNRETARRAIFLRIFAADIADRK